MKHLLVAILFAVVSLGTAVAQTSPNVTLPDSLKWMPVPGAAPGQMQAVIHGDPSKSGLFVIRIKSPDGYKVTPHYHASEEYVTVLQGTLLLGYGNKIDPANTTEVPTGGFYMIPKGVHHFAIAKGDTIVEISSMGPRSTKQVKP